MTRMSETRDDYPHVIHQFSDNLRVIICPLDLQWIIQKAAGRRDGQTRWKSVSFPTERESLARLLRTRFDVSEKDVQSAVKSLPPLFRRKPT